MSRVRCTFGRIVRRYNSGKRGELCALAIDGGDSASWNAGGGGGGASR
jgi:hypothetical protein